MKEFYTVTEAAERLGVSRQAIYGWIHMGWILYANGVLMARDLETQRKRMLEEAWDAYWKVKDIEPLAPEATVENTGTILWDLWS